MDIMLCGCRGMIEHSEGRGYGIMCKYGMQIAMILMAAALTASADTWRLEQGQEWNIVSATGKDGYLLEVAEIKKLISAGQSGAVRKSLDKLKKDYPEIASADLDAFIKAEILFSQGKFVKAVRAYDKFLAEYPESELREAALDSEFTIGTAFLAGQKKTVLKVFRIKGYAEGEKIMERISDRAGDAPIGVRASRAIAESLEKRGKFDEAYQQWSLISTRWSTGQTGKDALLAMGRCKHAAYKGRRYDASSLVSAKSYYEKFKLRYPKDAEELGIDKKLKMIDEQSAYKQFDIGRYYQQSGSMQSANLYYQMVVDNWPGSAAAKIAMQETGGKNLQGEKVEK